MDYKYFVGIDISKDSFSVCLLNEDTIVFEDSVPNTARSIKRWLTGMRKNYKTSPGKTLYCMEHTGLYSTLVMKALQVKGISLWMESGLQIKRSFGIQRGKADKIDARRIAQYAQTNRHKVRLWEPPRPILLKLKAMNVLRIRLVSVLKQLKTPLKNQKGFSTKKEQRELLKLCKASLQAVTQDYEQTHQQILDTIKNDKFLKLLFARITSVYGIGPVTAIEIIICTNEFKNFDSPKKFACYCGIAPFEHTSGTSVMGKTRISHFANKRMKATLHMAAISSIAAAGEMREYYKRKVAEGKPKMSVINAVRNKLIQRVFACVRDNRNFEKHYTGKKQLVEMAN